MRKIILNLAVSLDGYMEGPNGEFDWCFIDQDYGMDAFYSAIDVIFMGRKSYDLIANDPQAFADKKIYVFSDTIESVQLNATIVPRSSFKQKIEEIRTEEGGNIWLFGGANLISGLLREKLINIIVLSVHPIILGAGKKLFEDIARTDLDLMEHQVFSSGLVQLKYAPKPVFDFSLMAPSI